MARGSRRDHVAQRRLKPLLGGPGQKGDQPLPRTAHIQEAFDGFL